MTPIAAVSFDVGGTLLHLDPPPEVFFAQLCRELGMDVTPAQAAGAYARTEEWFNAHADLYQTAPEQFWLRGNRVLLEHLGVTDDLEARSAVITAEFPRRFAGAWRAYPEVAEVLGTLRRADLPLAVVSNWDAGLPALLERLDLREAFAVVVASAEAEVAKPDPRIFTPALEVLAVPPDRVLHVGDLYDLDVVGARAAGLVPVLLERRNGPRVSVFSADGGRGYDGLRIADLRELLPIALGARQMARR